MPSNNKNNSGTKNKKYPPNFKKVKGRYRWCTTEINRLLVDFENVAQGIRDTVDGIKINYQSRLVAAGLYNPKCNARAVTKKLDKQLTKFYRWSVTVTCPCNCYCICECNGNDCSCVCECVNFCSKC